MSSLRVVLVCWCCSSSAVCQQGCHHHGHHVLHDHHPQTLHVQGRRSDDDDGPALLQQQSFDCKHRCSHYCHSVFDGSFLHRYYYLCSSSLPHSRVVCETKKLRRALDCHDHPSQLPHRQLAFHDHDHLPVPSHQAAFTQVVKKDLSSSPSPSASFSPSSFCIDDHVLQPFFERRSSSFTTISFTNIIEYVRLVHRNRSTTPPTHTAPDSLIYVEQSYNTSDAGSDSLGSHSIMLL